MCSSGMREGAIPGLRLRNLTKIEKYGLYLIVVYESAKEEYTTFCSPECARAIDNYLEYRQRYNELLKPESPLIRAQFNKLDPFECVRKVKPISRELIHWTIHKLLYDSGLRQKEAIEIESQSQKRTRYEIMQAHGMRKLFETTAITAGMSPLYVRRLMGQKSGLEDSYFKPTENDLLEGNDKMVGYVGIIDALTINEEHRLRHEVEHYKVKASQFDQLKKEIDDLKELIGK
jgi:hypothetical protein